MTTQKPALFTLLILILLLTSGLTTAQEQSGYDIALERIEEARLNGAMVLDLSRLSLELLPPEIGQLSSLTWLYMDHNQLTILPPEIGQLNKLTDLNMNSNQLSSLPAEIGQLNNLDYLGLGDNQLTSLPAEIGQLSNLNVLEVWSNQLTSLPPELFKLSNLTVLDVAGNQFSSLSPEITKLSKLCFLILAGNNFRHLPTELAQVESLTANGCNVFVSENPLITPPEDVVAQGTPAILDYLRNQAAMQAQQITLAIAGMVGLVAAFLLAFRWKTQRSARKKKRVA